MTAGKYKLESCWYFFACKNCTKQVNDLFAVFVFSKQILEHFFYR